jgi:hypothetical protein
MNECTFFATKGKVTNFSTVSLFVVAMLLIHPY